MTLRCYGALDERRTAACSKRYSADVYTDECDTTMSVFYAVFDCILCTSCEPLRYNNAYIVFTAATVKRVSTNNNCG